MTGFKNTLKSFVTKSPVLFSAAAFITRKTPRILMYHRFSESPVLFPGRVDAVTFQWQLQTLSGQWNVMSLQEYVRLRTEGNVLPSYAVILTIDDGYEDFYRTAYPLLKRYGLKATLFPTVDFVEGSWMWWDRLRFILNQTVKDRYTLIDSNRRVDLDLGTEQARDTSWELVSVLCLGADERGREELISHLEKDLEVNLPARPTEEFKPVSWKQLREMNGNGIEIGSHGITHAILSRIEAAQLAHEIVSSKKILENRVGGPVSTFCYPNGTRSDINETVCQTVQKAGYHGATVSYNALHEPFDAFRIPRMSVSRDRVDWLWKLSGLESLVLSIRRGFKWGR
jgi:peptidoglycan/xylan/chitin deacetylase (PgdA/CDA1 family)